MEGLISPDLLLQAKGVAFLHFISTGVFTLLLKPHISTVSITVSRIRLLTGDLFNNPHHKSSS